MIDFDRTIATLEHVQRSVDEMQEFEKPLEGIPDIGTSIRALRKDSIEPFKATLKENMANLSKMRQRVNDSRGGIKKLRRELERTERSLRHVQDASADGPTGFAVAKVFFIYFFAEIDRF